jgi:hypothetical protein
MTRHEIEYYKNIERIATALEKLVAQGKEDKLKDLKKTANLIYGNSATVNPDKGRSDENYTYPQFVNKYYNKEAFLTSASGDEQPTSTLSSFRPTIESDMDARIHKESQSITGGEFSNWYNNLTAEEKQSYTRVYGH